MPVPVPIPVALHVGVDEIPWVPNISCPGAELRLLQADVEAAVYVSWGRLAGGVAVGTHRHTGAVHMFTLSGSWGYREHDFVNRAGSYLYEPPDSVHTFYVPEDNLEITETISIVHGRVEYLDEAGAVTTISDARTNLENYYASCEADGVARPDAILR